MDLAEQFVAQYQRQVDFYDQASRLVAQQLDDRLQASGIRAMVTARAKHPKRLLAKIRQRENRRTYERAQDIQDDIVDLAGTRVALYFPAQRDEVEKLIRSQFKLIQAPKVFPDGSAQNEFKRFSGYWATHYRVHLLEERVPENQQRYSEATVEIQVASVLMHAWAEVEHDLIYKPLRGEPSLDELAVLDELNGLVLAGELALERLQRAIDERVQRAGVPFSNHYELAAYLFEAAKSIMTAGAAKFLGEVEVLFGLLKRLDLAKPDCVAPYIKEIKPNVEDRPIAQQIIDQVLAADSSRYAIYSEVKTEYEQPVGAPVDRNLSRNMVEDAIQVFMSLWIQLEQILVALGEAKGLSGRVSPVYGVLRLLNVFDETELLEIDRIRRIRNQLVHGTGSPSQEDVAKAINRLQAIVASLQAPVTKNI